MINIDFTSKGKAWFIGIGGVSMSGLAEYLMDRGFEVEGSDMNESTMVEKLRGMGISVKVPQAADNIPKDADFVVYTAAIHPDNPEFVRARELGLTMYTRAQLLGAMMEEFKDSVAVAGTHGKTTTTGMISSILLEADKDPTISIGGDLPVINGNFRVGHTGYFITEACEYTNSYHEFYPKYNAILNIEEDHLDFFKGMEDIRKSFNAFACNTKEDGVLLLNADIDEPQEILRGVKAKVCTYGVGKGTYHAEDISYDDGGKPYFYAFRDGENLGEVHLCVYGLHNVSNAMAALGICHEMGIGFDIIKEGLNKFKGTLRRFEYKGLFKGAVIIDDYAHHPTEIRATLSAAKKIPHDRLVVVFQSHTYSRTRALLPQFADALKEADIVLLPDIYPARETDDLGVSSGDIAALLGAGAYYIPTFDGCEDFLRQNAKINDLIITMGAGDVFKIGDALTGD